MKDVGRPALSVGIPFFNEEARLAQAIRSILSQTMGDLELLLVDDGSTDRSLLIARGFAADPRVRVLSDGQRRGLPARLNEIAGLARAELVARMDADDTSHPLRFECSLEALRSTSASVVGTWVGLVDEQSRPFSVVEGASLPPTPRSALENGVLPHATMIAPRQWLLENPYDETLESAEDRDLWCRVVRSPLSARSLFTVVREPLYVVFIGASEADFVERYEKAHRVYRRLVRRYGRESVGLARAVRLTLASHLKVLAMRSAKRTGTLGSLVHRRGRSPTAAESRRIEEALRSATVPGHEVADLVERDPLP